MSNDKTPDYKVLLDKALRCCDLALTVLSEDDVSDKAVSYACYFAFLVELNELNEELPEE